MNRNAQELQAIERAETELVDESATFFAPVSSDLLDGLIGQHRVLRRSIEQLGEALRGKDFAAAMGYFLEASEERGRRLSIDSLADLPAAMAVLDATFWSKALALTDVLDCMPQARRDEWNKAISDRNTVPFTEEAVRPTIADLLASRHKFFSERVDGIFRGLSGAHVTNQPQGFSKRMIVANVLDSYGHPNHSRVGLINDLRSVIATFMGRPGLKHYETSNLLRRIAESGAWGEWHDIDGGAVRIRIYRGVGTAHLEINPEISYRLNGVLASLYPMAIPAKFRARPASKARTFKLMERPLPFAVLRIIDGGSLEVRDVERTWRFSFSYSTMDEGKHARHEAERLLEAIGGVPSKVGYAFDFNPRGVLNKVLISGCIPHEASHQFYPTPTTVAEAAVEMLDGGEDDTYLEPSAGLGGLACLLPPDRTTCVEISRLRCEVLRARGYQAHEADFIAWAAAQRATNARWTRCLMNPPYSDGRALAHLQEASTLIQAGGRLVAILPASMRGKDLLAGWEGEWSGVFSNEFAGTGVSVAIYAATRPPASSTPGGR
ncbi:DUF4942 domain-containing protein [Variovorax sp. LjRoot290]|uniref:DUF4942 domain-containing protein n=1 Tax=Variovorax sp. LjRoot290 TaxID=3342316 RepID=UPI003ECF59BC